MLARPCRAFLSKPSVSSHRELLFSHLINAKTEVEGPGVTYSSRLLANNVHKKQRSSGWTFEF